MQTGEICHVTLPPAQAYGDAGWPPKAQNLARPKHSRGCKRQVPPGATIEMDIELLCFTEAEVPCPTLHSGGEGELGWKAEVLSGEGWGRGLGVQELKHLSHALLHECSGIALMAVGLEDENAQKMREVYMLYPREALCASEIGGAPCTSAPPEMA
jgi:hypothetical protein